MLFSIREIDHPANDEERQRREYLDHFSENELRLILRYKRQDKTSVPPLYASVLCKCLTYSIVSVSVLITSSVIEFVVSDGTSNSLATESPYSGFTVIAVIIASICIAFGAFEGMRLGTVKEFETSTHKTYTADEVDAHVHRIKGEYAPHDFDKMQ